MSPITLFKQSIWEDAQVKSYYILGDSVFNNAQSTTSFDINNSLSWLTVSEPFAGNDLRKFQLISAKENLKDLEIFIEYETGSYFRSTIGSGSATLWLYYGEERPDLSNGDWAAQTNKIQLSNLLLPNGVDVGIPTATTINLSSIPRGSGVWLAWVTNGSLGTIMHNTGSKVTINAKSEGFYSILTSLWYKDVVNQVVKVASGIQNVTWNVNYYNMTMAVNGNFIRYRNDLGFKIKWQDIVKQLKERDLGAYYNESTDTLVIDHRSNILGVNNLGLYGDLAKKDAYTITEDSKFIINNFKYRYSNYQALKDNAVNGNYSTVHGETEWYINNKTFEGSIAVDLPFVRDSFMIEDLRLKELEYRDDTSTNEDDTIILVESVVNDDGTSQRISVTETINVQGSFDEDTNTQKFINDRTFAWGKIGVIAGIGIYVNDEYYFVDDSSQDVLTLSRGVGSTTQYNGKVTIKIEYVILTNYLAKIDNGLMNQDFSIRQNLEYWKQTLNVCNYYNQEPIINTVYKENKFAVINGLIESSDIIPINALHTPREIETTIKISISDYFYLKDNKIGYITIYDAKYNEIGLYIKDFKATFLNGCDEMKATIKGWLKN